MVDYQDFTNKDTPKSKREVTGVGDIWSNEIICNCCGDIIRSTNRHDFKWCYCGAVAVDGGSWYLKRCGEGYTEMYENYDYL